MDTIYCPYIYFDIIFSFKSNNIFQIYNYSYALIVSLYSAVTRLAWRYFPQFYGVKMTTNPGNNTFYQIKIR
jgi:hypothetical protein